MTRVAKAAPRLPARNVPDVKRANFLVTIQYKGQERTIELPPTNAFEAEAEFPHVTVHELISELIVMTMKKGLPQAAFDSHRERLTAAPRPRRKSACARHSPVPPVARDCRR